MTVKTEKRQGESFETMLKRFGRQVLQSGILNLAKKKRHHQPKRSKLEKKKRAIRKKQVEEEKNFLERLGIVNQFGFNKKSKKG